MKYLQVLCNLAPVQFFVDASTLSSFLRIEIENNSILAETPPLGAFPPDFSIYLLPANNSLQRLQYFKRNRSALAVIC